MSKENKKNLDADVVDSKTGAEIDSEDIDATEEDVDVAPKKKATKKSGKKTSKRRSKDEDEDEKFSERHPVLTKVLVGTGVTLVTVGAAAGAYFVGEKNGSKKATEAAKKATAAITDGLNEVADKLN